MYLEGHRIWILQVSEITSFWTDSVADSSQVSSLKSPCSRERRLKSCRGYVKHTEPGLLPEDTSGNVMSP